METPGSVKTHLRDMTILPRLVGSMVGVSSSKSFSQVETEPEIIGHYLGDFSITYGPGRRRQPTIRAT